MLISPMMSPFDETPSTRKSLWTSVITAISTLTKPRTSRRTMMLPPKIKCKQCNATLEMNDPGCTRTDCKIRKEAFFRKNPTSGLYEPTDMGKKRKKYVPPPKMVIIEETSQPPEGEVISSFKTIPFSGNVSEYPRYDLYEDTPDPWDDRFFC